ncbi:MAG: permease [Candidatus Omnitrophica bacterium]|nr:permease [Candidatus Omnitrophota bacterium]
MVILSIFTLICLLISFIADKNKALLGIKRGLKLFLQILPALLNVLILVSIFLFLLPKEVLIKWIGKDSGWLGIMIAAVLGSISLIPAFISYPLGAILLRSGATYTTVAVFLTTLMMVGVLTLPIEVRYFGIKVSILRNGLSFIGALVIGLLIGLFI